MKFTTWSEEDRTPLGERYRAPIFALYIFASNKGFLRPGAIGINRVYDYETRMYRESGNSAYSRFRQYDQRPAEDRMVGRGHNRERQLDVLPWSGHPWRYIWLAELTETDGRQEISGAAIAVAEQMLHFDIRAVFGKARRACVECPENRHEKAIEIAEETVRRFERLAGEIFPK